MPLKDDLFQRTLEQLAEAVRALLGLRTETNAARLEQLLQEAYREHTGSEAALLRRLGTGELLRVLSSAGSLDRDKAYLIAALAEGEAALAEVRGEDAAEHRLRALDLYLETALAGLELEEVTSRIAALTSELEGRLAAWPEPSAWRLFRYAWLQGRYAEAEDRLWELLERLGPTEAVASAGRAFYRELLARPAPEVAAGGLPRDEVLEGQAAFEARVAGGAS